MIKRGPWSGTEADARQRKALLSTLRAKSRQLNERVKELDCLSRVGAVIDAGAGDLPALLAQIIELVPGGWQYPAQAAARIELNGLRVQTANFAATNWTQRREIVVRETVVGFIEVCYLQACEQADDGPFLREEANLLRLLAVKLGLVAARVQAEADLRRQLAEVADLYEHAPCGYHSLAPDGRFLRINQTELDWLGYERAELVGKRRFADLLTPASRTRFEQDFTRFLVAGEVRDLEYELLCRDGRVLTVLLSATAVCDAQGSCEESRSVVFDISERKKAEIAMHRLIRSRAMMSEVNAAITTARDRETLYADACRIAVQHGGFSLAWIGIADSRGQIHAVASHGDDAGYVAGIDICLDPADPRGRGPTASALRENRHCVVNDIAADAAMVPWRDAALARGYRASVALPLSAAGRVVGVISLYGGEREVFDAQELKILDELAADVSLALTSLEQRRQIEFLAYYDALTGLANRALLLERLALLLQFAHRDGETLTLLLIDLEHFKSLNDALGSTTGDALLRKVAERLQGFAGAAGMIARVGPDIFALLLKAPDQDREKLPQQVVRVLAAPLQIAGHHLQPSVRIGVAVAPDDGVQALALFGNAEAALKNAKLAHEPYVFYAAEMNRAARARLKLEMRLQRAIDRAEFKLHYQPKYGLGDGRICGCEALLRWHGGLRKGIDTGHMIRLLEETGLIVDVGHWALQQAIDDQLRWQARGWPAPDVAVNVSAHQLRQPRFAEQLAAQLAASGFASPRISLEITESILMQDISAHLPLLQQLRNLGVSIAIDDFGTGYSSLSYLLQLPINALKVDRSFVAAMHDSPAAMSVVSTIISLAHTLNLRVVAEGVETVEQLRQLQALGCDEAQGFLFGPAIAAETFEALLRDGDARIAALFAQNPV